MPGTGLGWITSITSPTDGQGIHALKKVQMGKKVSPVELQKIISSRETAAAWIASARVNSDLGLAHLINTGDSLQGVDRNQQAFNALQRSLIQAPANPYAWVRLALVYEGMENTRKKAADALVMSILTGPHEPQLVEARLGLGFRLWNILTAENREYMHAQIRYGLRIKPSVVQKFSNDPKHRAIMRAAFASNPALLINFERQLPRK